jgi:hypothetical protein
LIFWAVATIGLAEVAVQLQLVDVHDEFEEDVKISIASLFVIFSSALI